jgi:hypothetical protein
MRWSLPHKWKHLTDGVLNGKYICDKCGKIEIFYHNLTPDPDVRVSAYSTINGYQHSTRKSKLMTCEEMLVHLVLNS